MAGSQASSPHPFFRRRHLADKLQELTLRAPQDAKALEAFTDYVLRRLDLDDFPAPSPAKAKISRVPTRLRLYS